MEFSNPWTLLLLLPLIALSALCSCSETVLFGFSAAERCELRRRSAMATHAVDYLLSRPSELLVTVLTVNMAVNTLYFAAASVYLLESNLSGTTRSLVGAAQFLALVLFGEVLPKMIGNSARVPLARAVGPVMTVLNVAMLPVRLFIDLSILRPLHRIMSPRRGAMTRADLGALIDGSEESNGLEHDERELLKRVISYRRLRVRDVMTRRGEIAAITSDSTRAAVVSIARSAAVSRLLVYDHSLDRIAGVLPIRHFLLDSRGDATPIAAYLMPAKFVPEAASIEQLGAFFIANHCDLAVVVDEHGGTSGIVSVEDAVESVVGNIADLGERTVDPAKHLPDGSWLIDADTSIVEFADRFGLEIEQVRATTVGGFMLETKGEFLPVGTRIDIGGRRLQIEAVVDARPALVRVWPRQRERGEHEH
ncbi:MAG: DUF21 domain-containing protein [Phycisphaerales bacterium]|nr:DUF21 domain-containing protein [Phycisphaerales bacterium]